MSNYPANVQSAIDKALQSKEAADAAAADQVAKDAAATAADQKADSTKAQLASDAKTAVSALAAFLVVSPPPATTDSGSASA